MTISVECDAGGRHEFEINYNLEGDYFNCAECGFTPRFDDIIPMLNAAMQLSPERLRQIDRQLDTSIRLHAVERQWVRASLAAWRGETDG